MPYLHIQISGASDDELAERVASAASDLTARLLHKDPALTAVAIDFVPASQWFVAGLNADDTPRELTLDLAWLGQREGQLISDGTGPREFAEGKLAGSAPRLTLAPRGGFVARFR